MLVFLLFSASVLNWVFFLPINLAEIGQPFQNICKDMSPSASPYLHYYMATICGVDPPPDPLIWDLREVGLYHLIVVSGAHLIFLNQILEILFFFFSEKLRFRISFFFLFFYSLFSGLNPPVVRALATLVVRAANLHNRWRWSEPQVSLVSGLSLLALFPAWWGSLSFLMSWTAAVGLSLCRGSFEKCALVYLLMLAPLSSIQVLSPLTIFMNWLFAPIIGFLILPFSLLPFLWHPLAHLSDVVWMVLLTAVSWSQPIMASVGPMIFFSRGTSWFLLFSWQALACTLEIRRRRSDWKAY